MNDATLYIGISNRAELRATVQPDGTVLWSIDVPIEDAAGQTGIAITGCGESIADAERKVASALAKHAVPFPAEQLVP